jgi:hypothetical protein
MGRTIFAGLIGAIVALVAAFLVVGVISAIWGVDVMFDPERAEYGWDGAHYGMLLFLVIGVVKIWPFLVIITIGAAIGVIVQQAGGQRGSFSRTSNP